MLKVLVCGNVTKDLEIKAVKDKDKQVCNFDVASNRIGAERVDYITIEVWNKQAELCAKYLKKGSGVTIIGDLQTDSYKSTNGNTVTKYVVRNPEIQFTDKKEK